MGPRGRKTKKAAKFVKDVGDKGKQLVKSCIGFKKCDKGDPYLPTQSVQKAKEIKPEHEPPTQQQIPRKEEDVAEESRRRYMESRYRSTSTQSLPAYVLQENVLHGVTGQGKAVWSSVTDTHHGSAHHGNNFEFHHYIQKDALEKAQLHEAPDENKTHLCVCGKLALIWLFLVNLAFAAVCFCLAVTTAIIVIVAIIYATKETDYIKSSIPWMLVAVVSMLALVAFIGYSFICVVKVTFRPTSSC